MPVSTKILGLLNLLLLVGLVFMLMHGRDHNHGAQLHHDHHGHEHIEFDRLLGVEPSAITFIEVRNKAMNALLIVNGEGGRLYQGEISCGPGFDNLDLQLSRELPDARVFNRWQTFFSMMTPDAQIRPNEKHETYGLDQPIGCIRIGLNVSNEEQTVVHLDFGELTVQGLNHYIKRSGDENIYLIPRYFWLQTAEIIEAGLR
jgi:hypothetical protein